MELSLSLGDSNTSSKELGFLAKNGPTDHMNINKKKSSSRAGVVGLGFCMALGTINSNGPHHKSINQNIDDDADHNSSSEDTIDDDINQRLRLHFLPLAPPPSNHSRSLRWSSDIGSSDNGSSGNVGLPTAVARVPKAGEEVSSPNSVASSFQMDFISILRGNTGNKRDHSAVENDVVEAERASSRASDEDENGINTRKKLRLSKEQSAYLEDSFKEHNTLNPKQKLTLAKQLNLRPRQVEVWFQNRRARTKLKQTEVDCEYMKRCWERLREENRRLQKELGEVRALKSTNSKPFYMQLPPTTLTMCPSCERVATTSHRS